MTSIMDQEEGYQRLSAALHEIDRELCGAGTAKKQQAMNEKKVRYGNETDGSMENMYEQQVHRGSFIKEVYRPNPQQMQIYEAEEKETQRYLLTKQQAGFQQILSFCIRRESL